MTLPPLGPADLLVESGQNFVDGWTIQRVKDYGQACAESEREACAQLCDRFGERHMHPFECAEAIRSRRAACIAAKERDTEDAVWRIMDAAYEYASTAALVRDALDAREERAELERIVREALR